MLVKCNKCGFVADIDQFTIGHDFFQNPYVAACPNCDNNQTPGGASVRGFGGERPFEYIRGAQKSNDPELTTRLRTWDMFGAVVARMSEAS